jgi:hypothetical protein
VVTVTIIKQGQTGMVVLALRVLVTGLMVIAFIEEAQARGRTARTDRHGSISTTSIGHRADGHSIY